MTHRPKLHTYQERRLAMTFRMQQALAILQMPQEELSSLIQEEIDKNPLLKEIPKVKKNVPFPDIAATESVYDKIQEQIRERFLEKKERKIAEKIYSFLDEKGFLSAPIEEIAHELNIPIAKADTVLSVMKTFEPHGIFAKNLQESLLIQLKAHGEEKTSTYTLIQDHFSDLLHHRYHLIQKKCGALDLPEAIEKLALLQLRPLDHLKREITRPIIVDIAIKKTEQGWAVKTIEDEIPTFELHSDYDTIETLNVAEKETIQMWKSQGKWLLHALSRRRKILLQIAIRLTAIQSQYLSLSGKLKPITTQELACDIGVHESTISRAISEKYAETPRGILPLKSLLSKSPETGDVKKLLLELVNAENKSKPLTDDELAHAINGRGHKIARRTLSKYRKELKIRSSQARKDLA
jgi:RNA polymerase sigma-54 factor